MDMKEPDSPEKISGEKPAEESKEVAESRETPKTEEKAAGINTEQKKVLTFAGIGFLLILVVIGAVFIIRSWQAAQKPPFCRHYGNVPEESVAYVVNKDDPELLFGLTRVVYSVKDPNWAFVGIDTKGVEKYKAYTHKEKCPLCKGKFWVVKAWGPIDTTEKPGGTPGDLP